MPSPLALIWDLIARDNASPAFNRVGDAAKRAAGETEAATGTFTKFGLGAVAAGVVIAAESVKMATHFQSSMLLIQTQAGASAAEVKKMSTAILGLAGDVATAPEKLATSLFHVESVGLRGAKALDVVKIAAEGAKIGHADLEQTTNALTSAVVSGITGVQNMGQAMGALNAIVGVGDMNMENLNEAMGTGIMKVAKIYGLSLTDVGAALADFGDNNIRGADAASQLRMAIMGMAKPVAGGAKFLATLGISAHQLATDMQTGGLNKALVDLKTHLDDAGITGTKVGDAMLTAFGKKAGVGIPILIDDLSRIQTKMKNINDGAGGFGSAWEAVQKTASFQFSKIVTNLEVLGVKIGTVLLPYVTKAAEWINNMFSGIGKSGAWTAVLDGAKTLFRDLGTVIHGVTGIYDEHKKVIEEVAKAILGSLIAVLVALQTAFKVTAEWISQHKTLVEAVAVAVGAAALAWGLWTAAIAAWEIVTKIAAAAMVALNTVMDANPIMLVVIAIAALAAGLVYAYDHSKTFRDIVKQVWADVSGFFEAAWRDVIKPVIDGLEKAWDATWHAMTNVWNAVRPVLEVIGKVIYALVALPIVIAVKLFELQWRVTWAIISTVWRDVGKPVFEFIGQLIVSIWRDFIKPTLGLIADSWKTIWDGVQTVWRDVGKPVFDGIGAAISFVWKYGIKPIFRDIADAWSALWGGLGDAFSSIWGGITTAIHDGIGAIVAVINFFIRGIDDILGALPGGFHINQIQWGSAPAPALHGTNGAKQGNDRVSGGGFFATGGVLPGYSPGVDNIRIPAHWFSGGEGILVPEATRALGGAHGIQAINSMFSNRVSKLGHFAGGGIITPADAQAIIKQQVAGMTGALGTSNPFSQIGDAVKTGLRMVALGALDAAEAPLKAVIGLLPHGMVKSLVGGGFNFVDHGIRSLLGGQADKAKAAMAGSVPTGDHMTLIASALKLAGDAASAANEAAVNLIITNESGWNPNAINLTDSNAAAGHPSQGLMQTIPGTFEAYRLPGLPDVITDPLANIVAGIRYAISRYGSLSGVPGVASIAGGGGYVGYDSGGLLMPGITPVLNMSGKPEAVLTNGQWEKLDRLASGDMVGEIRALGDRIEAAVADLPRVHRDMSRQGHGRM